MATQWQAVQARLVAFLPTLPSWSEVPVYDGAPVTGDAPSAYATVGYVMDEVDAGSFERERLDDWRTEERGFVRCALAVATGDADLTPVRARAFALLDELDDAIAADRTLGVLSRDGVARLIVDVAQMQTKAGAAVLVAFSVDYLTRT